MGAFGFTVHVRGAGSNREIGVEGSLDQFELRGFTLRSSRNKAPNIQGKRWPLALDWMVIDRLRSQGARKGRVLAVWYRGEVVAACTWHLHEDGPLVIFDLGCRSDLPKEKADRARTALLLCLRDVAKALGRSTRELRWTDEPLGRMPNKKERERARNAVRQRAAELQFGPLRPCPKWLRNKWVFCRRFGS